MIPLFRPFINEIEHIGLKKLSSNINEGEKTVEFEKMVAERCGREYGIAVTSGTIAIQIAVKFECYHEVHLTNYCVLSPYNAIRNSGKEVELMDIDKQTLCQSEVKRRNCNTVLVHFNNHKVMENDVVHDISHCIGTDFSDITGTLCLSFSAPKTVTTGQGGMILTNNKFLANEIRRYKNHGRLTNNDEMKDYGNNFKFNDILAIIGIAQMQKLDYMLEAKTEINAEYEKYIKTHNPKTPWIVIFKSKNAHGLERHLNDNDIMAKCLYKPINDVISYHKDTYENSEWAYDNLVYLPSYVGLSREEIRTICERINEYESQNN
jgi:perosamine synthetase